MSNNSLLPSEILFGLCINKKFWYTLAILERRDGATKKEFSNFIGKLIAVRMGGEPFFGFQTLFAPLIDKIAKKRGHSCETCTNPQSENIVYTISAIPEAKEL